MQPSTSNKRTRRRVSDAIKTPQPSERVMDLLAALDKAQKRDKEEKNEIRIKKASATSTTAISNVVKPVKAVTITEVSNKKKKAKHTVATTVVKNAAKLKASSAKGTSVGARMAQTKQESGSSSNDSTGKRSRNQSFTTQIFTNKNYQQSFKAGSHPSIPQRIPQDVLDNIHFRFLANIPDEEKKDNIRICFQIELAQWFYIDFYCTTNGRKDCPNLGVREFARQIFNYVPEVKHLAHKVDYMIDQWRIYKSNVPTYGAILLDSTLNKVLLVQGYYSAKNKWGFPKGKVNENEHPRDCAVREVREETGFDFSEVSNGKEHKIQKFINDTMIRLYIATDVPMDFPFSPQTRNEIRKIEWFNVWDLPVDRNDYSNNQTPSNFYTIIPFVQDLHNYIKKEQARRAKERTKSQPTDSYFNELTPGTKMQPMPSQFSQSEQQFSSVSLNALFNNLLDQSNPKVPAPSQPSPQGLGVGDNFKSLSNLFPPSNSSHPVLSTQSHFRPVENGPAHVGSSIIDMLQTGAPKFGSPQIAQPIPVQAKAQGSASLKSAPEPPKERKTNKIRLSETSAFTAIQPSRTIASNASSSSSSHKHSTPSAPPPSAPSVADMELELQRFLGDAIKISSKESELLPNLDTPTRELNVNSIYSSALELQELSHIGEVQLCHAWKSFKLNAAGIFLSTTDVHGKS